MTPRQLAISGAFAGGLLVVSFLIATSAHAATVWYQLTDSQVENVWVTGTGNGMSLSPYVNLGSPSTAVEISGVQFFMESHDDGTNVTVEVGLYDDTTSSFVCAVISNTSTLAVHNVMALINVSCTPVLLNPSHTYSIQDWGGSDIHQSSVDTKGGTAQMYFQVSDDGTYGAAPIDWTAISPASPFTLGTTSSAIAASSSLWASITVASTSLECSTGNVFSDALCSAGSFLFVPSPSILGQYAGLPQTMSGHFPFSWLYEVQTTLSQATSSTGNLPAYSIDLFSAATSTFASTTMPDFLPSFTFFSSTTVMTYLPSNDWSALQSLLAAVLWLGIVADIFFTLRNRFHRV